MLSSETESSLQPIMENANFWGSRLPDEIRLQIQHNHLEESVSILAVNAHIEQIKTTFVVGNIYSISLDVVPTTTDTFAFDDKSRACVQTLVEGSGYQNLSEWLCNQKQQATILINNVVEIQSIMSSHPSGSRYAISPAFRSVTALAIDYQYIDDDAWTSHLTMFFNAFRHLESLKCVLDLPADIDCLLFASILSHAGKDDPFRAKVPVEEMLRMIASGAYFEKAHAWKLYSPGLLNFGCHKAANVTRVLSSHNLR
jgi:hypothetical protein